MFFKRKRSNPAPKVEWELWYRDTFDRETPPSVDVRGRGLVKGLTELWARHLFETVRPGGGCGFSRFHLRMGNHLVHIAGDPQGAVRLREWVFGQKEHGRRGYVQEGAGRFLAQIASIHAQLLAADQSSEPILSLAASTADRHEFEARLSGLAGS